MVSITSPPRKSRSSTMVPREAGRSSLDSSKKRDTLDANKARPEVGFLIESNLMMSPTTESGISSLGSSKHGSSLSVAVCNSWKLCGSDLSPVYEGLLHQAAILFGASVNGSWNESTTHVIVPTFEYGTCCRSLKVLKAIMCGQWIITVDWIKACIQAKGPVPEEPYEVIRVGVELLYDTYGPKKGRLRAIKKEPKIFVGFRFYLGNQFDDPLDRCLLEDVIAAAGGSILGPHDLSSESSHTKLSSSYIVVNVEDPLDENGVLNDELSKERGREVARVERRHGFRTVCCICVLNTIAACNPISYLENCALHRKEDQRSAMLC